MTYKCPLLRHVLTCHKELSNCPEALDYLKSRFVTDSDIQDFYLGVSNGNWNIPEDDIKVNSFLRSFNTTNNLLVDKLIIPNIVNKILNCVLVRSYYGEKFYRLWFRDGNPPYANLMGIEKALGHIKNSGRVIVFESFFDLVAVRPWYGEVITSYTASMNIYHLAYLKRFCKKIYIGYNNDYDAEYNTGLESYDKIKKICDRIGLMCYKLPLPSQVKDFSELRGYEPDLRKYLAKFMY